IYDLFQDIESKNELLGKWARKSIQQVSGLKSRWDNFEILMNEHETLISQQVEVLKKKVRGEVNRFNQEVDRFAAHWHQKRPKDDSLDGTQQEILEKIAIIKEKREEFDALVETKNKLVSDCSHFALPEPEFPKFDGLEKDLRSHEEIWLMFEDFNNSMQSLAKEEWIVLRSKVYLFEELLNEWKEKLDSDGEPTTVSLRLMKEIDRYQDVLPLLKFCRGDMFSQQHWIEMYRLIGLPSSIPVEKLTLSDFLSVKEAIVVNAEAIKDLNGRAQGEVTIREALNELDLWGAKARFNLTEFEDSKKTTVPLIKDWKDILNKLGDNQCLLQSLKDTPYYQHFSDRASIWETRLADLDSHLQNLNQIQRKWVYLEPIFGRGALPNEQSRFKRVDDDFKSIMAYVARDDHVISLVNVTGLGSTLSTLLDQLHRCQKSLNEYLEEKRSVFPRFYFIGDDDLLEILGRSTDPRVMQTHLKKLFAGIHSVDFDDEYKNIVTIKSLPGEVVPLKQKVLITSEVEKCLDDLCSKMKDTLKSLLIDCLADNKKNKDLDPSRFPSQILCLTEQILFTERCELAMQNKSLAAYQKDLNEQLNFYTSCNNDDTDEIIDLKLKALILDIIHHIKIVDDLIEYKVKSTDEWMWQKQLRFYLKGDVAVVCMVDAEFEYTYEYQGNAAKLVHTPLTDKCYLTLTQGLHMGMGGNPYGPAGTGKTESVKALGSLMGRQVLVFNCDEGIDVKSMGRIFIGLVKCGAWGCFDEFNRLEEEVMSAVSMQIQTIQAAVKSHLSHIQLLERKVDIDPNSGIFITLNPAGKGYGGRQKLPDNLKQLFRPVAMSRPDNDLIAEVILFAEGFKHAKAIGKKLVAIFTLALGLLTQQQHYDWGLRALKTVLKGCGNLLRMSKCNQPDDEKSTAVDEKYETQLIVQALRLNTLSKLTYVDSKRFDSLINDVFCNVDFNDIGYVELAQVSRETIADLGLIVNENQVKKVLELYEQLQQRMGVVIVGPSGSGKTTLWKVLKQSLNKLQNDIKLYTMNPKAMPRTQLLGHIDIDTREWIDGVLTKSSRQVVKENPDTKSWIICDGDIDPEWIESLNSVLDDNHLLTMPSGERIQFGPNVNFIFETDDLSCASPATISRMGIIFLSDEDTDVKAFVGAWLNNQSDEVKKNLSSLIEDYFYRALEWVLRQNDFVVNVSLVGVILNGLSHLHDVDNKQRFLVALLNGLGSNLSDACKDNFAREVFSWMSELAPDQHNPLNTFYDPKKDRLQTFVTDTSTNITVEALSSDTLPLIRTASVNRCIANIMPWLHPDNIHPFILVGPEGCGKSMILKHCFQQLRSTQVATVHCSAQTSPQHILQKLSQVCLVISTNTGRVYRPKDCERLVLYAKDLNLPKPDKWGTCQLIAFLQQLVTYNGFYDANLEWVGLEGIQLVGSMNGSQTLGKHELSKRFTSVVRICVIGYQRKDEMQSIYQSYLAPILSRNLSPHPIWSDDNKLRSLSGSMVQLYDQVKSTFTADEHGHYQFTPQDLTRWTLGLARYDIDGADSSVGPLLDAWSYEASRIFRDRIVGPDMRLKFDGLLTNILRSDWGVDLSPASESYFVSWGAQGASKSLRQLPPFGKHLGKLSSSDFQSVVEKGIVHFNHEVQETDRLIFTEILDNMAFMDHILTQPGGSALLAGRSGIGRRLSAAIVAHMHHDVLFTPKVSQGYVLKNFKNDLKTVMQQAGVEGEQVVLILEDHQIIDEQFLELINSILSAGEVPGLYSVEELEPILSPLRDQASQDGFRGTLFSYFALRVKKNLHVVLVMDYTDPEFSVKCESNPAFYKHCSLLWLDSWCSASMAKIPRMLLGRCEEHADGEAEGITGGDDLIRAFVDIHESCPVDHMKTPRRYLTFVRSYIYIYNKKKDGIENRRSHLQAGVSKLNEARTQVQKLKSEAAEQSQLLAEKQAEADAALKQITMGMQDAGDQKTEMEKLKDQTEIENEKLEKRKVAIDEELTEIEPLVREAMSAVGNIKSDSLSEIRSLRVPPDVIRDILEGVLRLMGIFDTSWVSMKSFLAKRGIKDEICNFDARRVTPEIRQSVEKLLKKNIDSFDPKNAKRASAAAAPLAAWVQANVKYSYVLQKINPLETEQARLKENLQRAESRMGKLSSALTDVDQTVAELRDRLNRFTKEAAEIEINLNKANETINAAETLVTELDDEYQRWTQQLEDIASEVENLPLQTLLATAFITYLPSAPEDVRHRALGSWTSTVGLQSFDVLRFLSSEGEQLAWKNEGLPQDVLSIENALIILQSNLRPFLIDPSSRATEWLKTHLKDKKLEVLHQQDSNFVTSLELAIRFGKTLVVQEVDSVEPVLYPILRGDVISQGTRYVIQIGDKLIDYNEDFRLYLTTRNPSLELPAYASSVLTKVNFKTTEAGLRGQLLAVGLQHEKPELEVRKTELLHQEEEMKVQLMKLEETLLEDLANSSGNILDNQVLLESLKKTKASSSSITASLSESVQLQKSLDEERDVYLPVAEFGSRLYFVITDMSKLCNMYRFSLSSFLRLFQRSLQKETEKDDVSARIQSLIKQLLILTFEYVCRSLFKSDRLMFALHLVHGMYPSLFQENEWDAFSGTLVSDLKMDAAEIKHSLPRWIDEDRTLAVGLLRSTFPTLYQTLQLEDEGTWMEFSRSNQCEVEMPTAVARKLTLFQQLLLIQALRPDRLQSAMILFVTRVLGVKQLSPSTLSLKKLHQTESICTEPILMIVSPGADPSQELQELATQVVGDSNYMQIALGQGQSEIAINSLHECAKDGKWLCLKNLHLVVKWLPVLEKELNSLEPHENFRLWLTSEIHAHFSPILLQSSLKVTFEAPPGIKKNLQRTYDSWMSDSKSESVSKMRSLFMLAWFHAVLQERRTYIPQGWTKFYEFNFADLRAAADVISRLEKSHGGNFPIDFIHGLFESAIYGGRIDNPFDIRVLSAYLRQYFDRGSNPGQGRRPPTPNIAVPSSSDFKEYLAIINGMNEEDKPSDFGLPANIERSVQRTTSVQVIAQLKIVLRSSEIITQKDLWNKQLSPNLNLWKKLNQGLQLIQMKVSAPAHQKTGDNKESPILSFIELEHFNGIKLVQSIHTSLAGLSKVIRGTALISADIHKLATSLLHHQTPASWQDKWEGSEDPMQYMRQVIYRAQAVKNWLQKAQSNTLLSETLFLSDLFRPDTFLSALRQQTARECGVSMNSLILATSWRSSGIPNATLSFKIGGMLLEGCVFDGNQLSECHSDTPSVSTVSASTMAWVPQETSEPRGRAADTMSLPVYFSESREKIVTCLDVPCSADKDRWILAGAAFFLKS
ncbi:Uncharacterised protein at_DN1743, partial [Pycnogonum litorale]